jgi:multicomponent K+:H+ antiporter subunit C
MEIVMAAAIGILTAAGVYLLLRPRSFEIVVGLTLLSYAINLLIFAMGRPAVNRAPILEPPQLANLVTHADPLPQALVLTAIVISFAMTALLLVLAVRAQGASGSDLARTSDDSSGVDANGAGS